MGLFDKTKESGESYRIKAKRLHTKGSSFGRKTSVKSSKRGGSDVVGYERSMPTRKAEEE